MLHTMDGHIEAVALRRGVSILCKVTLAVHHARPANLNPDAVPSLGYIVVQHTLALQACLSWG